MIAVTNGRVVDPSTGSDLIADVLIAGDRVVDVRPAGAPGQAGRDALHAETVLDATGKVVTPGFIDSHTHSDFTLPRTPAAPARIHQGITTDVTGNCGFSPFPLQAAHYPFGAFFDPELVHRWTSLQAYSAYVADQGPAINVAPMLGLGSVRLAVIGDAARRPGSDEMARMQSLLEAALQDGAFGVSSGLIYPPGRFSGADELAALLSVLPAGRLYATHLRDERDRVVTALAEAIDTSARAGARLQVSHHKVLGPSNRGGTHTTLRMMEAANAEGGDVAFDYYPFTSGSTGISSLLPESALTNGWDTLRRKLKRPTFRTAIERHLRSEAQFRLDEVVLGTCRSTPAWSGMALTAVAAALGQGAAETAVELIATEGERLTVMVAAAHEEDLRRVAAHPLAMHGSDAWLMTAEQARYEHPRNLDSTIRLLEPALDDAPSLMAAVYQLSTAPAERLSVDGRGSLRPGSFADLVVLDPSRRRSPGTAAPTPPSYPALVRSVLVNGVSVLRDGELTGSRPGRVLRAS